MPRIFNARVAFDFAIAKGDDAVGELGGVGFVGDENDRVAVVVEAIQDFHYLRAGF